MEKLIINLLGSHIKLPQRCRDLVIGYLFSLMIASPKHTLSWAGDLLKINRSQLSRFLANHSDLAREIHGNIAEKVALEAFDNVVPLIPGTDYRVAILIDATLHGRSTLKTDNSQHFNHGSGFVVGHQWTNIVLKIGDQLIPLPPIPFYTRKKCRELRIEYKTEHEKVIEYLNELKLEEYIGSHNASNVVCLMDAGYDNKKIQQAVLSRNWTLIMAIKKTRGVRLNMGNGKFEKIEIMFRKQKKQSPWKTVNIFINVNGKKKTRRYRTRQINGELKGLPCEGFSLICSEKSKGKGRVYFMSSDTLLSIDQIIKLYRCRWSVETFHKEVKSYLGFEDLASHDFKSQESHVAWVYCAYLLLRKLDVPQKMGIKSRQEIFKCRHEAMLEQEKNSKIIQLSTRFNAKNEIKKFLVKMAA
jgi:hypothetical protein